MAAFKCYIRDRIEHLWGEANTPSDRRQLIQASESRRRDGNWFYRDIWPNSRCPTYDELENLHQLGFPRGSLLPRLIGCVRFASVIFDLRGTFRFPSEAEIGEEAIVHASVMDATDVDACAWTIERPNRIASFRGLVEVHGAYPFMAKPVRLFPNVLEWLRASGNGIAPSTGHKADLAVALRRFEHLVVADHFTAARLRKLIETLSAPTSVRVEPLGRASDAA